MDLVTTIDSVRRACRDAGEPDPLDEAAMLAVQHRLGDGVEAWVEAEAGFAVRRGAEVDLAVAPDARRRGVGGRLAELSVGAAGEVRAWSHGDHPGAAALAERHGLERTRSLWVMRRSLSGPLAEPLPPLEVPDGVIVRGYQDSDADVVVAINAAAFADHPEQGAMDRASFDERAAQSWFDPEGLLLAVDDSGGAAAGDVLGFHWTKRHGAGVGEVYVVGIAPAAQGRGVGKLLTLAGLHHLREHRIDEVLLYVESDNAPAVAVYGGLGFTHADSDTHVQYSR